MADELSFGRVRVREARKPPDGRVIGVEVKNATDETLYVWATPRAMTYDPDRRMLSVRFGENPIDISELPNVRVISSNPRVPSQLILESNTEGRLIARVPPVLYVIDLDAPRRGLGLNA